MRHEDPAITPANKPSDYFYSNIVASFSDDPIGLKNTALIGADNYMWSNDYPHCESSWPRSRDYLDRNFQGAPEAIKCKITWEFESFTAFLLLQAAVMGSAFKVSAFIQSDA